MRRLSFLYLPVEKHNERILPGPMALALRAHGELTVIENAAGLPDGERAQRIREHEVLFSGWGSAPVPAEVAENPGKLRWICQITGELRKTVPIEIIRSGVAVTNWGDTPASAVAEGALTLLLAVLKDLHHQVQHQREGRKPVEPRTSIFTLEELRVGVYGLGVIGKRFLELLAPFHVHVRVFDPYLKDLPPGCERASSLEDLFSNADAIVIHAGQTPETIGTVNAGLLARLPDGALVINTARPLIIDQDALFSELSAGRLRAGLDVVNQDDLPPGHPIRCCENLIWTGHRISNEWPSDGKPITRLRNMHRTALDNLVRYLAGEELRFRMDETRYLRST
jgi:phosphoglycerate dehydrogenase-like enzyme